MPHFDVDAFVTTS